MLADARSFHTERYVRQMRKHRCNVLLVSLEDGGPHHFKLKHHTPLSQLHYPLAQYEAAAIARRFKPDIINPHFISGYGHLASFERIKSIAPIVSHIWGSDVLLVPTKSPLHRRKVRRALNKASLLIADSQFIMNKAKRIGGSKTEEAIIPWGIEKRYIPDTSNRERFGSPLKIIVPRPHLAVYRNEQIIDALAPLIKEKKVKLTFPDWGSGVKSFAQHYKKSSNDGLILYERLPREQFMKLMSTNDIYLSNSSSDSSPASMIEAMALGLIPVAASHPGLSEWLTKDNGFEYDSNDMSKLTNTIQLLIDSTKDFNQMRESNIAMVHKRGIFENNIEHTIELMKRLAGWSRA